MSGFNKMSFVFVSITLATVLISICSTASDRLNETLMNSPESKQVDSNTHIYASIEDSIYMDDYFTVINLYRYYPNGSFIEESRRVDFYVMIEPEYVFVKDPITNKTLLLQDYIWCVIGGKCYEPN